MEEKEKLKHLVAHWKEHNREHAETYRSWAEKMKVLREANVSKVLDEIADRTNDLDQLFHALLKALK